jgi:hypothetical protein
LGPFFYGSHAVAGLARVGVTRRLVGFGDGRRCPRETWRRHGVSSEHRGGAVPASRRRSRRPCPSRSFRSSACRCPWSASFSFAAPPRSGKTLTERCTRRTWFGEAGATGGNRRLNSFDTHSNFSGDLSGVGVSGGRRRLAPHPPLVRPTPTFSGISGLTQCLQPRFPRIGT